MNIEIPEKIKKTQINDPKIIAEILCNVLKAENELDRKKEHLWAAYLNSQKHIKKIELVFLGTVNKNFSHPREIFRGAIKISASSLILAHNHPDGEVSPSKGDLGNFHELVKAGEILGIDLIDNIIITQEGKFYSFKQEGLLEKHNLLIEAENIDEATRKDWSGWWKLS